jgi:hypothetical protein
MKNMKKYMVLAFALGQGLSMQMFGYISQKAARERQAQLVPSVSGGKVTVRSVRAPRVQQTVLQQNVAKPSQQMPVTVQQSAPPVRPALIDLAPTTTLSSDYEENEVRQKWLKDMLAAPMSRVEQQKGGYQVRKSSGRIALEKMIQNENSMLNAFNAGTAETQKWLGQAVKVLLANPRVVLDKSNVDFVRKNLEEATRDELVYSFNTHGNIPKDEQTNLLNEMKEEISEFIIAHR